MQRLEATSALVRTVYKATWQSFYTWEQENCRQTLLSLARAPRTELECLDVSRCDLLTLTHGNTEDETFTVVDYRNNTHEVSTLSAETTEVVPPFKACPPYEICTPASRNIYVGDDFEEMPFIQMADDPKFDIPLHTADYSRFEWQLPHRDPDLQAVIMQTVYTLHMDHKLPFETIDETGVLPLKNLNDIARRRDFPGWLNIPLHRLPLPYFSTHVAAGPMDNLSNLSRYFCNNRNCLIGYCTVHIKTENEIMAELPLPEPIAPTVLSGALAHSVEAPCGKECFILGGAPSIGTFWTENDIEICEIVLSFSPDLSPCDLAVICRKPCREVFKHRRRAFPDTEILHPDKAHKRRTIKPTDRLYRDLDAAFYTPKMACSHPGPCDARSACVCFHNHAHCESGCRCDQNCQHRWIGCTCAKNKFRRTCRTSRCPCFLAHRECNPELCIKCDAKNPAADICRNASIQRGEHKRTEVRQSKWGLGLFLSEDAEKGDLIIEYTGELIFNKTVDCRDLVARHCGRVYLFELNPTLSIDSSKAGNESRFINHDPNKANAEAGIRLTNGEHRIGIFALKNLSADAEVLLNYGDLFFQADSDDGDTKKKREEISIEKMLELDQHSSDETYND